MGQTQKKEGEDYVGQYTEDEFYRCILFYVLGHLQRGISGLSSEGQLGCGAFDDLRIEGKGQITGEIFHVCSVISYNLKDSLGIANTGDLICRIADKRKLLSQVHPTDIEERRFNFKPKDSFIETLCPLNVIQRKGENAFIDAYRRSRLTSITAPVSNLNFAGGRTSITILEVSIITSIFG